MAAERRAGARHRRSSGAWTRRRRPTQARDPRHSRARRGGPGAARRRQINRRSAVPRVHRLGLALPPDRMPLVRDGRPLKRWRYVGVYTAELMLCVGEAHVARPAAALVGGRAAGRHARSSGRPSRVAESSSPRSRVRVAARAQSGTDVSIELELGDAAPVEVVSPHGGSYIWTAKRAPVQVRGEVRAGQRAVRLSRRARLHRRVRRLPRTPHRMALVRRHRAQRRRPRGRVESRRRRARRRGGERAHGLDRRRAARGRAAAVRRGSLTGRRPRLRALGRARALDVARPRAEPLRAAVREIQRRAARRCATPADPLRGASPGGPRRPGRHAAPGAIPHPATIELAEGYGVMEDHDVRW